MIRGIGFGHVLFAAGLAGLGILSLLDGDFALQWQPVPPDLWGRQALAYVSGLVLLAGAAGTFFKPSAAPCALILTLDLLLWILLLHAPVAVASFAHFYVWLGLCEILALASGGWILYASLGGSLAAKFIPSDDSVRIARILFAVCCLLFGVSHIVYANETAFMIPAWLPFRPVLADATGAGHIAAGIGILFVFLPRLAATFEAIMMSSFVLLVHLPSLVSDPPLVWAPTSRIQLTSLCVATTLAGAAWIVARSLGNRPWGLARKTS